MNNPSGLAGEGAWGPLRGTHSPQASGSKALHPGLDASALLAKGKGKLVLPLNSQEQAVEPS